MASYFLMVLTIISILVFIILVASGLVDSIITPIYASLIIVVYVSFSIWKENNGQPEID